MRTGRMLASGKESESSGKFARLPADVHFLVMSWVQPTDLILGLLTVSNQFYTLATDIRLWRSHCELLGAADVPVLTLHQIQRCCLFEQMRRGHCVCKMDNNREFPTTENDGRGIDELPPSIFPASVLVSRGFADSRGISARVCLATTTDRENERVENVLQLSNTEDDIWDSILSSGPYLSLPDRPARSIWQEGTYWSSAAADSNSEELLLFTTRCPLALMSDVAIKPFRELSFLGLDDEKTYTWPGIVIRVYRLPVGGKALRDPNPPSISSGFPCIISKESQLGCNGATEVSGDFNDLTTAKAALALGQNAPQRQLITAILAGQKPVYESKVHEPSSPDSDVWQHYALPPLTAGNVITLNLVGKNHRQFPTSGHYVCVDQVAVRGIPIFTDQEQARIMGHRFQRL
mmetsp:Transcript_16199/g.46683  ORF Transcript_16199/g.46683 Transcript_16199/m.46683 type:complete len:406 (-) Transcript_16199:198-1415(-)|eukprot:CAMPEP_0113545544 /NCGR_PEP_ID=MMETSP0015_2-20120614/11319_1 /TAXON_ID=2838 /ORGANISM="Odontella" /LENGTH=405 /DNA_ID=CAMNT_0000445919 /DNA_START=198 /DNA_END=1415 /DNA_ORIENTATION=+ /assembly_acc=CAM_ASM_000160